MARTRSVEIQESLHELDQLRQYYRNTPQAQRLLFLYFLKEDPKRTITEAAEKAELSVRRGERLWESYRRGGVGAILSRRGSSSLQTVQTSHQHSIATIATCKTLEAGDAVALANAMAFALCCKTAAEFVSMLRKSLSHILVGLGHTVINFRYKDDIVKGHNSYMVLNDAIFPDGTGQFHLDRVAVEEPLYQRIIQDGRRLNFPFDKYLDPIGFDFYFGQQDCVKQSDNSRISGQYVASWVLFFDRSAKINENLIRSFIERSRPFISCAMYCALINYPSESESRKFLTKVAQYDSYSPDLTAREQQVLSLRLLGKSTAYISDHLCIAKCTVNTHLKAIYKKAGVSNHLELVSRHYAASDSGFGWSESDRGN